MGEHVALAALPLALNVAGLLLLAALVLAAVALRRAHAFRGFVTVPAVLAALMLLTLGAILASGSSAVLGLVLAVFVVSVYGAAWVTLGWALRPTTDAPASWPLRRRLARTGAAAGEDTRSGRHS